MNRNTPGEILPLREHQPQFLRSLRRDQDESRRRSHYKRCSYPTLREKAVWSVKGSHKSEQRHAHLDELEHDSQFGLVVRT